jgi:hypothetical protein
MDQENVAYIHNGVVFSHKEEQNCAICRKTDRTGDHRVPQNKLDSESSVSHVSSHMGMLKTGEYTGAIAE